MIAWYVISAPYPNLSAASTYWAAISTPPNSTVAGSDLRYGFQYNVGGGYGAALYIYSPLSNGAEIQGGSISGRNGQAWSYGGTALTGSWRTLTGCGVRSFGFGAGKGGPYTDGSWYAGLWVRYA
jgi:hypothetical protein